MSLYIQSLSLFTCCSRVSENSLDQHTGGLDYSNITGSEQTT